MIRFYNGRVLRFGGGMRVTEDEVWTEGGSICCVGSKPEVLPAFEREIDLKGDLLLPGFKNAHTHTAMTFLRSYADDMPLQDWLTKQVFPNEAKLTPDMVYTFTRLGILEYLSSGITASFDMYVKNDAYAAANIDSGFRTVICSGLNNFDADPENIEREYLKFNALHELVSYRLGIHAEYTTSMERMRYAVELSQKYKAPCYTHLCETQAEVQGCIERYGMTPPQLLDSIGFFDYGGGGFHCVWMSEEDIALFARKKLCAVTNPCSNLKLASGIAPVDRLLAAGRAYPSPSAPTARPAITPSTFSGRCIWQAPCKRCSGRTPRPVGPTGCWRWPASAGRAPWALPTVTTSPPASGRTLWCSTCGGPICSRCTISRETSSTPGQRRMCA